MRVDGHTTLPLDYVSRCVEALQATGSQCVGGAIRTRGSGAVGRAIAAAQSSRFGVGGVAFRPAAVRRDRSTRCRSEPTRGRCSTTSAASTSSWCATRTTSSTSGSSRPAARSGSTRRSAPTTSAARHCAACGLSTSCTARTRSEWRRSATGSRRCGMSCLPCSSCPRSRRCCSPPPAASPAGRSRCSGPTPSRMPRPASRRPVLRRRIRAGSPSPMRCCTRATAPGCSPASGAGGAASSRRRPRRRACGGGERRQQTARDSTAARTDGTSMMPELRVAVIGLGYVGLPLAMRAVEAGYEVVGFDVDRDRIEQLVAGQSFVDDVTRRRRSPSALGTDRFHPTADPAGWPASTWRSCPCRLRSATGHRTCRHVEDAASISPRTCVPGAASSSSRRPTRDDRGDRSFRCWRRAAVFAAAATSTSDTAPSGSTRATRRGGSPPPPRSSRAWTRTSLDAIAAFYSELVDKVVPVAGTREAELAKLLENTFRHVNIALVNELAIFCHESRRRRVVGHRRGGDQAVRVHAVHPGPGVGGHCLPIDPSYLSWQVRRSLGRTFRFVEIANDVNDHMPDYVVARVCARLNKDRKAVNGSTGTDAGLTYKPNSRTPGTPRP